LKYACLFYGHMVTGMTYKYGYCMQIVTFWYRYIIFFMLYVIHAYIHIWNMVTYPISIVITYAFQKIHIVKVTKMNIIFLK